MWRQVYFPARLINMWEIKYRVIYLRRISSIECAYVNHAIFAEGKCPPPIPQCAGVYYIERILIVGQQWKHKNNIIKNLFQYPPFIVFCTETSFENVRMIGMAPIPTVVLCISSQDSFVSVRAWELNVSRIRDNSSHRRSLHLKKTPQKVSSFNRTHLQYIVSSRLNVAKNLMLGSRASVANCAPSTIDS